MQCNLEGPKSMDIYDPKNNEIKNTDNRPIYDPKYLGIYDPRDIDLYDIMNVGAYDFKHMTFLNPSKIEVYNWTMSLNENSNNEYARILRFNDFLKDHMEGTEIKITLFDENGVDRAYHYV